MVNNSPDELDEAVKRTEKHFKELVKEEETKVILSVLKDIFDKNGIHT
jgi:hypothetical protein